MSDTFDPSDARDRQRWRYDSAHPLSVAQLVARHSVDVGTAALVWLLLECGASLSVAGWETEMGKTTTLGALLQLLPAETSVRLTAGMLEDFAFTEQPGSRPGATCVVCSEINAWPPYYMWGEQARRFLALAARGWQIATTLHANTLDEVITLYREGLGLQVAEINRLGIVVNLGLVGVRDRQQRRWLTTHFLWSHEGSGPTQDVAALRLSRWRGDPDTFESAHPSMLVDLARWAGTEQETFNAALARRADCLHLLAQGDGADAAGVAASIALLRRQEPAGLPRRGWEGGWPGKRAFQGE